VVEQQLAEERLGEFVASIEDQEVVEIKAGGDVGSKLEPNVVAAFAQVPEPGPPLDRPDLHGKPVHWEQAAAQQVGQQWLELQRHAAPLVEQDPQP
jgi:hypothetical protein